MHAVAGELGRRGVGFSTLISSGNEAIVNTGDYLGYLADDPSTKVIMAFVEGIKEPRTFVEAANKATTTEKPIVLVKIGRSQKGIQAAVAHTGTLAGSDRVVDALFKQLGIIRVADISELIETVVLFGGVRRVQASGVAITTTSGGEAGMYSDVALEIGLKLPDLSSSAKAKLQEVLPPFASPYNPLDTTGVAALDHNVYEKCLTVLSTQPDLGLIAVSQMDINQLALATNKATQVVVDSVSHLINTSDKAVCLLTPNVGSSDFETSSTLMERGIPLLMGTRNALKAIHHLISYSSWAQQKRDWRPLVLSITRSGLSGPRALTVVDSMNTLSKWGIPTSAIRVVGSESEAVDAANELGYPVVLKVVSSDLPHKSDVGGVMLDVQDDIDVGRCYRAIYDNCRRASPSAHIRGISVEKMFKGGIEAIIGVKRDPQFGPTVLVGSGGVLVELLKDSVLRLAPLTRDMAFQMIRETRLGALLSGYRGGRPGDIAALADITLRLADLFIRTPSLVEVEINPVVVFEQGRGAVAVDGLVVCEDNRSIG